jgi:hypothetical protein
MGFWHTGYMEFHGPLDLEGWGRSSPPPVYACTHCRKSFTTAENLHVGGKIQSVIYGSSIYSSTINVSAEKLMTSFNRWSTAEKVSEGIDLSGKNALVTGANTGLGMETARVLNRGNLR